MGSSVLVCGNAAAAGRTLVTHPSLKLRWALTPEECLAAIQRTRPDLVLVRSWLADGVLAELKRAPGPAAIVLLDPAEWGEAPRFLGHGAAAVIEASQTERIFEAVSGLTGAAFAKYPRVEFKTVVDVFVGGQNQFLETYDMSVGGVSILAFPKVQFGTKARLNFDMLQPALQTEGLVARYFKVGDHQQAAGLVFQELTPGQREQLTRLVHSELQKAPMPMVMGAELSDHPSFTAELAALPKIPKIDQIKALLSGDAAVKAKLEPWVLETCERLTPIERATAMGHKTPPWARSALQGRLSVASARSRAKGRNLSRSEFQMTFELCQSLAEGAKGGDAQSLVELTEIRAALLGGLYGTELPVTS